MLISSCYYDKEEELYPNQAGSCDTTGISYSKGISTILNGTCAVSGCHVAGGQIPDLSDYSKVQANSVRVKVRAVDLKTMPPGITLSDCNIKKLDTWIQKGTPQ